MGLMASLCNICVCVCVCVLCALCPVLCAVCCVLWGAVEINKNRILMVFCSFLATKNETTQKQKTRTKKGNKRKEPKKEKKSLGVGGGVCLFVFFLCAKTFFWRGVVCLIHNLVLCSNLWQHFSFEQPFPPAANVEEHCWLAMQLGANTCPPSIWWGTQPPIRMKMDSNCAQLHG